MRASFVFSEVVNGLRRNVTMTIAMILTTAISLGLLGGGLLAVMAADRTQQLYSEQTEVAVFLNDNVSKSDGDCSQPICQKIEDELSGSSIVDKVDFQSQQQAYQRFLELFSDNPELAQLAEPDALPASLRVKLTDEELYPQLNQQFTGMPGVDSVVDQAKYVDEMLGFVDTLRNAAFSLALIQLAAALMLISNTIQLSAFSRRTETGIMRLVGASRWYTQLPFLLEAAVSGLVGAILGAVGLGVAKVFFFDKAFGSQFGSGMMPSIGTGDVLMISPLLALIGIAIASITGYVTLRLYVRV